MRRGIRFRELKKELSKDKNLILEKEYILAKILATGPYINLIFDILEGKFKKKAGASKTLEVEINSSFELIRKFFQKRLLNFHLQFAFKLDQIMNDPDFIAKVKDETRAFSESNKRYKVLETFNGISSKYLG